MATFWKRAARILVLVVLCLFVILVVSHFGFKDGAVDLYLKYI